MKLTIAEAYAELGVPESSSLQECKTAYKRLALLHHPDKNPDAEEEAKFKFQRVAAAYQKLEKHHSGAPDSDDELGDEDSEMFAMDLFSMLFADLMNSGSRSSRRGKGPFFSGLGGFGGMGGFGGEHIMIINGVPVVIGGDDGRRQSRGSYRGRGKPNSSSRGRGRASRGGSGGFGGGRQGFPGGFGGFGGPFGGPFGAPSFFDVDDDEDLYDYEMDSDDDEDGSDFTTDDEYDDDDDEDDEDEEDDIGSRFSQQSQNRSGGARSNVEKAAEAERLRKQKAEQQEKLAKERTIKEVRERQRLAAKTEANRRAQEGRSQAFRQAEQGDVEGLRVSISVGKVRVSGFEFLDRSMQFSNGGETLLHIACRIGSIEMVSMLLAHGASVTDPDAENHLPTHVAAMNGRVDVLRHLLDRGASIDPRDGQKRTPLFLAGMAGQVGAFKLLHDRGARVGVTDANGKNVRDTIEGEIRQNKKQARSEELREIVNVINAASPKQQPKSKGKKEKELDRMRREMDERLSAEQAKRGRTETEEPNVEHPEAEMEKEETDHRQKEPSGDQFESEELEKEEQDQPPAESQNLGDQIERERLEKEEWDRAHREAQNRQKADDETLSRAQRKLRAQQASADAISGIAEPQRAPQHTNPKTKKQQNLKSEKGAAKAPSGGHINGSNNTTVHNVNSKGETATSRALASAPVPDFSASESGFEVPRSSSSSPDDLSSMIFEADVAGLVSMGFSAVRATKALRETGDVYQALDYLLANSDEAEAPVPSTLDVPPPANLQVYDNPTTHVNKHTPLPEVILPAAVGSESPDTASYNSTFWAAQLRYGTDYGPAFSGNLSENQLPEISKRDDPPFSGNMPEKQLPEVSKSDGGAASFKRGEPSGEQHSRARTLQRKPSLKENSEAILTGDIVSESYGQTAKGSIPSSAESHPRANPKTKFSRPCYFWAKGLCSKGDTCTFSHCSPQNGEGYTGHAKPIRGGFRGRGGRR